MLEELAVIRFNAAAGRYSRAIAAMKDTSALVIAREPQHDKPKLGNNILDRP